MKSMFVIFEFLNSDGRIQTLDMSSIVIRDGAVINATLEKMTLLENTDDLNPVSKFILVDKNDFSMIGIINASLFADILSGNNYKVNVEVLEVVLNLLVGKFGQADTNALAGFF